MDQPIEYIVHFAKVVKLYQQKNRSCFGCRSPEHLMQDCPKDIVKTAWKAALNAVEGMAKKGRSGPPEFSCHSVNLPSWNYLSGKISQKTPFLNLDPLTHWSGPKNIAQLRINDESCWALLDNGSTINAVTPELVKAHSLDVGPWATWLKAGWVKMALEDYSPNPEAMLS